MDYLEPHIIEKKDVKDPLITIVTATTGAETLKKTIESVQNQTYENIQHLIVVDGEGDRKENSYKIINKFNKDKISILILPYPTGLEGFFCHRIYGLGAFVAKGEYICYLNDNDFFDSDHIESNIHNILKKNLDWSYSFRKIVDKNDNLLCYDDCESLGKWCSYVHPEDHLIDVNCYMLKKKLAIHISPIWYRKFGKGHPDADRTICKFLMEKYKNFETTFKYSVNYRVDSGEHSVKIDFFEKGNELMKLKYSEKLPWKIK